MRTYAVTKQLRQRQRSRCQEAHLWLRNLNWKEEVEVEHACRIQNAHHDKYSPTIGVQEDPANENVVAYVLEREPQNDGLAMRTTKGEYW